MSGESSSPFRHQNLADLVEHLQAADFPVGLSESIDATQLLLALAKRMPGLDDPARLRSALRPVFCRSREQQERFDDIFNEWWTELVRADRSPAPETGTDVTEKGHDETRSRLRRWIPWAVAAAVVVASVYLFWLRQPTSLVTPPPPIPGNAQGSPLRPEGPPGANPESTIAGFVPALRYSIELRTGWLLALAVLPITVLVGLSYPALVLTRTRLRRRSQRMFLDPVPLATEARRLVPPMAADISDRLSRHIRSQGTEIERFARRPAIAVRRTIEATLRNYGIPTLRFSVSRVHPSYLLLVDVANEEDPRGRLFLQWAQRLAQEGLAVEILLVQRAAPNNVRTDSLMVSPVAPRRGTGQWTPMSRLRGPQFGERLIVVSDGDPLVDAAGRWRVDAVRSRLYRWRDRALFTPVEPRDWGDREVAIERSERPSDPGFIVLPLEESALRAWIDLVHTGHLSTVTLTDPQRFPSLLRPRRGDLIGEDPPSPDVLERLIEQLRAYLGNQGFYWLAAIAVTPIVRWELTLLVGKAALSRLPGLGDQKRLSEALARNYRRLVRLPWLQRQTMPDWLRLRLLLELSHAQQGELRTVVERLLEKVSPRAVADGIELAFERPPGTAVDRRAQISDRAVRRNRDVLYLSYMSGVTPEQLVLRAPKSWPWARRLRLRKPGGLRARLARVREHVGAGLARWLWTDGLPHLGLNRRRFLAFSFLFGPLVAVLIALIAVMRLAPAGPLVIPNRFFEERAHPLVISTSSSRALAFNADGSRIASGGADGTVRLWDAQTGRPIGAPLWGHSAAITSVAFSRDGRRLVSGSLDATVRVWDAVSGVPIGAVHQSSPVLSVAVSRDGLKLLWGTDDGTIVLQDPLAATLPARIRSLTAVRSVALSVDERRVAYGADDGMRIWETSPGRLLGEMSSGLTVRSVAFSPDGRSLAYGTANGSVKVMDAETASPVASLEGHTDAVTSVAYSPDSQRLISGSMDGTLRLWNAQTGAAIGEPLSGHGASVWSVAFSPDGRRLASAGDDDTLRIWTADAGTPFGTPMQGHSDQVLSVAFSSDGRRLISGSMDGTVRRWDAQTGRPIEAPLPSPTSQWSSVAFSPDGRLFASVGFDQTVTLWDAQTAVPLSRIILPSARLFGVTFSPDSRRVAAGTADGSLFVSSVAPRARIGYELPLLRGHAGAVTSVAYSGDGRRLASGGDDASVRLWDAGTDAALNVLSGHAASVQTVTFSPDSRHVASGSSDRTVRVWDVQTGALIRTLQGHTDRVSSVAFSQDGRRLVSASDDGTLRIWDLETGRNVGSPLPAAPTAIAFSPNGEYFAVASGVGANANAVRLWRIDPSDPGEPRPNAATTYQMIVRFVESLEGRSPLYWLLGTVFAVSFVSGIRYKSRLARLLSERRPAS